MAIIQFLFILVVPVVLVAGGAVTLFAVGALFDALDNPSEISGRIEAFFRCRLRPSARSRRSLLQALLTGKA